MEAEIIITDSTAEEAVEPNNKENVYEIPPIEVKEKFFDFMNGREYIDLKLTEMGVRLESPDGKIAKNLSYQGLVGALSNKATLDTKFLPILGNDYIAVRRYMIVKDRHYVFIEASPRIRKVSYSHYNRDEEQMLEYNVPFPGLLFVAVIQEKSSGETIVLPDYCRLYALQTPIYNEAVKLFHYPLTNVFQDAKICWGDTLENDDGEQMRHCTVSQSIGLLETFLSAENNSDLFNSSWSPIKGVRNAKECFDGLSKLSEYPFDTLVSINNLTFNGLISLLTENGE